VRRLLILALVLAACGGTSGGQPPWRGGKTGGTGVRGGGAGAVREFAPAGAPAAQYNDGSGGKAIPSSPLHEAASAAVRDAAATVGVAPPAADPRLYAVAGDLAGFIGPGELPSYEVIEFALHYHGIVEPSPEIILVTGDERAPEAVAEALAAKLPEALGRASFARLGVGVARQDDGAALVVVALQESHVETEPLPRRADMGKSVRVRGRVLEPFGEPTVFVTGVDGSVAKLPVVRDGGRGFGVELRCEGEPGARKVEVIGRGPKGVSVLANFPFYCGQDPPTQVVVTVGGGDTYADAADAERIIFRQMNADRAAAGLPPLAWDEKAAAIARAHSQDMATNHFVAHVSPTTGTAADRARAGGLATPLVLENVARAYSPGEAQRGFMNSPGHRANLLSSDATHVGVGVVLGDEVQGQREIYVTQLFFRVPPKVSDGEARAAVRAQIVKARAGAGLPELRADADLDALAQHMAERLARGQDRDDVQRAGEARMDEMASKFSAIMTVILVAGGPEAVGADAVADDTARFWGLGVAQGDHAEVGPHALYVVILLARPR
jgi:uncharacterized protein YkwD